MGGTVAAGLCYTSRPQDDSGAFSDSGEREGGRASYRSSFCLYEGGSGSAIKYICAEG